MTKKLIMDVFLHSISNMFHHINIYSNNVQATIQIFYDNVLWKITKNPKYIGLGF